MTTILPIIVTVLSGASLVLSLRTLRTSRRIVRNAAIISAWRVVRLADSLRLPSARAFYLRWREEGEPEDIDALVRATIELDLDRIQNADRKEEKLH